MAKKHDYVPRNDAEFNQWFKFLNQYVNLKCTGTPPEWTHIPAPALTAVQNAYAAWYTAWAKTFGPHTPVDTEAKNDAKKAAAAAVRPFVNQYLRFPPVTDEDRTAMGIPNHDATKSEIPPPDTVPELTPDTSARRRITVHYRDEGSARRDSGGRSSARCRSSSRKGTRRGTASQGPAPFFSAAAISAVTLSFRPL
jgi:hypothetical protein